MPSAALSSSPSPSPASPASSSLSDSGSGADYKSLLNSNAKSIGGVRYETVVAAGGLFVSTAVLEKSGERWEGAPQRSKKAAEQAAGRQAWESVSRRAPA